MKCIVFTTILIAIVHGCSAQFFAQKKTRRELLMQQIAALQVYTGYLKKGYDIAKNGINTINDIKQGDYDLHDMFFTAAKEVNPAIAHYSKTAAIVNLASDIENFCNNAVTTVEQNKQLTMEEKQYLKNVFTALLAKTGQKMEELNLITTDRKVEMHDNDRIEKIENIYIDMKGKYAFVQSFSNTIQALSAQRSHTQTEISNAKALNRLQ